MDLADRIAANRRREARYLRAEKVMRRIRQRIFDYEDESAERLLKAQRVMATCSRILAPKWRARRAAAEDRKLQETPSYFEPGGSGVSHGIQN